MGGILPQAQFLQQGKSEGIAVAKKWVLIFFTGLLLSVQVHAQDSLLKVNTADTLILITKPPQKILTPQQVKKRVRGVAIANVVGYSAILVGLNAAWYADYPRSSFHFFDDNKEWLQVDKVGHFYSAYIESRSSMELWRWTGTSRKKRIWLGGLSGFVYQSAIEILDGFSTQWGFSWAILVLMLQAAVY